MRLTCPNCAAQYEVPDTVIPLEGRDVQCSNCARTWFFSHPDHPPEDPTDTVATPVAKAEPVAPANVAPDEEPAPEHPQEAEDPDADPETGFTRREIDPEVIRILRAEAAHEAKLRAAERGQTAQANPEAAEEPDPAALADPMPDATDIGTQQAPDTASKADSAHQAEQPAESSGGFFRGFSLVILLAGAMLLVYLNAARLSDALPDLAPALSRYVGLIDQGRVWLDATWTGLTAD